MRLEGKVALVTGSGRGIGREIALAFAGDGADAVIWDVNAVDAEKTAKDIEVLGRKALSGQVDVTDFSQVEEGINKIFEEAGFNLRQPGCSACLGMNEDKIPAGKYVSSL